MLDGHPDIRAVALDYYGTLVDVGKPFDRIRAWFAEKLHGSGVDPQTFFHRFSRERARLYTAEFRLGYELLVESYEAACVTDNAPLPEEVVIMDEKKRDFLKVWDTLPDDTRELLADKYILRMSDAELAEEFGCSPDSIRMKLTRARRKALEMIKEGGFCFDPA